MPLIEFKAEEVLPYLMRHKQKVEAGYKEEMERLERHDESMFRTLKEYDEANWFVRLFKSDPRTNGTLDRIKVYRQQIMRNVQAMRQVIDHYEELIERCEQFGLPVTLHSHEVDTLGIPCGPIKMDIYV